MTPTTDIGEIFARIDNGMVTAREGKVLKEFVVRVVYEFCYSGTETWHQCRLCHRRKGEGHADHCPAQGMG